MKDEVAEKLDLVVRLLAYLVAAEHDNLQDKAVTLTSLGLFRKRSLACAIRPPTPLAFGSSRRRRRFARRDPPLVGTTGDDPYGEKE